MRPRFERHRWWVAAGVSVVVAAACGGGDVTLPPDGCGPRNPVASVTVTGADSLTALGQMTTYTAEARDGSQNVCTGVTFTWSSDNTSVLTIDQSSGQATAVDNGEATISASASGQTGTKLLTVAQAVASVTVTPATAEIAPGGTQQYAAEARDANNNLVSGVNFFWSSHNPNVATINSSGLATGIAGGTVEIAALGKGEPGYADLTVTGAIAGTATQVIFSTDPSGISAGAAVNPAIEVELQDDNGLRVDVRVDVALAFANNAGGGTLLGTTTVRSNGGIASFSGISVDKVGTGYTIEATAQTATPISETSAAFNVTAGAPAKVVFTTQPGDAEANIDFSPAVGVSIFDEFDNVTSSTAEVSLTLQTTDAAAELLGTTTVNAVNGVATFSGLRMIQPGSYSLTGKSGTLPLAASDDFTMGITFSQVAGGDGDSFGRGLTCGIAPGGAFCWGRSDFGRLGVPPDERITGCPTFRCEWSPVLVRGGHTFTHIAPGDRHACAVDDAGDVWCWGNGTQGQIGDGNTNDVNDMPIAIAGPANTTFVQVASGALHSCALTDADAVWCWGWNGSGQLGNGTTTQQTTPVQVSGSGTSPLDFRLIAAGGDNTCAINGSGAAYCWGEASSGALGDNNATNDNLTPGVVSAPASGAVTYRTTLGSLAVGRDRGNATGCAVRAGATPELYCWGENSGGQIGDGTSTDRLIPVLAGGGLNYIAVGTGFLHTCAIVDDGTTRCWGRNFEGQLGDGGNTNSLTSVVVQTAEAFTQITGGYLSTCALRADGQAFCWGLNSNGQLGNESTGNQSVPVAVKQD